MWENIFKAMDLETIEKYKYLSQLSFTNFSIPNIIEITNKWIYFEYIPNSTTLSIIIKSWKDIHQYLYTAGKVLWELHVKLSKSSFGFHNDYWSGNILFDSHNNVYIIDFEKYVWFDERVLSEYLTDSRWDVSMFLFHLKYDISFFALTQIFFSSSYTWRSFLYWYKEITWVEFSQEELKKYIWMHVKSMIDIERKNSIYEKIKRTIWKVIYFFWW
jgi:RIO-like serine/threonine protein kinase